MAIIKPFKGIRPSKDKVHLVASRSVEDYNSAQLTSKLTENPYTFLHVIKPEFKETNKSKTGSIEQLQKIKKKFVQFIEDGILEHDKEESFYIYRHINEGMTSTGIIGCASIWDYYNNTIRIHEQTITDREDKLKKYLEICDFNAEPVCLAYPDNKTIDDIISKTTKNDPINDFSTTDKIHHLVWKVSDPKKCAEIILAFEKIPTIYITDGHHRTASSAILGKSLKAKNKNHTGKEPYNFFMAIYFPESDLKIFEFNRIIKDLNFLTKDIFFRKLATDFTIDEKGKTPYSPIKKGDFSMYFEENWYSLTLKKTNQEKLDTELLTELILSPLLDIHNLRTDSRISFVNGTKGAEELKKIIDTGKATVGFGLYPVTISDIVKVANSGKTMPPKSTWVEPKIRSGLVIYSISGI